MATPLDALRYQIKVFAEAPLDARALIPTLHRWIREDVLGELLIDVADYTHVPRGPGALLVGHGSNYALDNTGGRSGVLYTRKRAIEGAPAERVRDALRRALLACKLLQDDPVLDPPARFCTDELLFRVQDRLLAPNTAEAFAAAEGELSAIFASALGGGEVRLEHAGDPRDGLTARVEAPGAPALDAILAALS